MNARYDTVSVTKLKDAQRIMETPIAKLSMRAPNRIRSLESHDNCLSECKDVVNVDDPASIIKQTIQGYRLELRLQRNVDILEPQPVSIVQKGIIGIPFCPPASVLRDGADCQVKEFLYQGCLCENDDDHTGDIRRRVKAENKGISPWLHPGRQNEFLHLIYRPIAMTNPIAIPFSIPTPVLLSMPVYTTLDSKHDYDLTVLARASAPERGALRGAAVTGTRTPRERHVRASNKRRLQE
ncbi:hypothetical protein EVAR_32887_1 [Eumeta japonica]|uniref:Uncharacterized protein n=1 Tax=Eumeta variegata TaxID=151549 RepID=A0A4C1VPJ7_EUMVA|nr:hypothetical protein EVAR_32887_1 [Eumeta japonica]